MKFLCFMFGNFWKKKFWKVLVLVMGLMWFVVLMCGVVRVDVVSVVLSEVSRMVVWVVIM